MLQLDLDSLPFSDRSAQSLRRDDPEGVAFTVKRTKHRRWIDGPA